MREREVEKLVSRRYFVSVLRRLADTLEQGDSFRLQVAGRRFTVPKDAELLVEHEVEGDHQELSFELIWKHDAKPSAESVQMRIQAAQIAAQMGLPPEPAMAEQSELEEWDEEEEEEDEDDNDV